MKLLLGKIVLIAMILSFLGACSDGPGTRKALAAQGFTEIKTTGYQLFGCGQDDTFHTGFEAMSPAGVRVTGVACSGIFKGTTLRFH